MSEKGFTPSNESCVISDEVLATIACTAAKEVPGVAGLAQRPNDIRGVIGSAASRSVKILKTETSFVITVYITVELGCEIQEVASQVQQAVKKEIQSMTGRPITRVDVNVAGVKIDEKV